jgi:hypothetical protein
LQVFLLAWPLLTRPDSVGARQARGSPGLNPVAGGRYNRTWRRSRRPGGTGSGFRPRV